MRQRDRRASQDELLPVIRKTARCRSYLDVWGNAHASCLNDTDEDPICAVRAAGLMSAKLVKSSTLKVYPGLLREKIDAEDRKVSQS